MAENLVGPFGSTNDDALYHVKKIRSGITTTGSYNITNNDIPNYKNLTEDNFIVVPYHSSDAVSSNNTGTAGIFRSKLIGMNVWKKYYSNTGLLTIGGVYNSAQTVGSSGSGVYANVTVGVTYDVYCIYPD